MNIMFICTGNICRSAMAEAMLKAKIREKDIRDIEVYSCGIYAENDDCPTYNAIDVMQEYEINLKQHRATNILNSKIKQMDLILCATNSHKVEVLDIYPDLKNKTYTMKEYVSYKKDGHDMINIKDPWGYDIETYRYCASEIADCLELLLNKIKGDNYENS